MISVGIDISKDKSTVCILKPYGEVLKAPFEINHTKKDLSELVILIKSFNEETRVIMEATGYYHLPVLNYLQAENIFVSVVNAIVMNKYSNISIRKGKTDKKDSIKIANYGLDFWFRLIDYKPQDEIYKELNTLSRQYHQYISVRVKCKNTLNMLLDKTMPGIDNLLSNNSKTPLKNKLNAFVKQFWHYDNITKLSEKQFINSYNRWTKKEGYFQSQSKPIQIYALAKNSIPTLSSKNPSTKMLVLEAVRMLNEIEHSVVLILSQMEELAKNLKEYSTVLSMEGIGRILVLLLIAEIGNIKKFHSSKALIAYAGIDTPPHQSGSFNAKNCKISKRGSKYLRKIGFEVMTSINIVKPQNGKVYLYIQKKINEGKAIKVAKIAGLNKFLKIYYARVNEVIA